MLKHAETIRRLLPTNCLSVSEHFVGLAIIGLIPPPNCRFCIKSLKIKIKQANNQKAYQK